MSIKTPKFDLPPTLQKLLEEPMDESPFTCYECGEGSMHYYEEHEWIGDDGATVLVPAWVCDNEECSVEMMDDEAFLKVLLSQVKNKNTILTITNGRVKSHSVH